MGQIEQELFDALLTHDLNRTEALLSHGADPNSANEEGWRPLHIAVGQLGVGGHAGFVDLLLQHGADPNGWDASRNETPLLTASEPPELKIAQRLLEAGADPNARRSDGESPLRLAVRQGSHELATLLLRHGADKSINTFGGDLAWTALGIAASRFDLPMIELLLEAGADPMAQDDMGRTARDHLPPRTKHDPQEWDRAMEMLGRRRYENKGD
jgi:ankyrin repeat protein